MENNTKEREIRTDYVNRTEQSNIDFADSVKTADQSIFEVADAMIKDGQDMSEFADAMVIDEQTMTEVAEVARQSNASFVRNLLIDVLIAALFAAAILFFVRPSIVKQTSMLDTLQENDYIIMYQRAYKNATPERGDIIIFESDLVNENNGKNKLLIKRVIGLPGDRIKISDNQLYINGEKYEEDYIKDGITPACEIPREGETFTVPEGKYFVMGDNRVVSVDSRYSEVGCVSLSQIKGKAVLRLFPFNRITKL